MGQNVFEILGVERRELSYSNFLAWLMDPSLNGKVGDEFLRRFLELKELKLGKIEYDFSEDSIEVSREDSKSESEADIVVMNNEFQLVIENKVKSKEGKKQTSRLYEDWCGSVKDEIFVYLTPEYRGGPESDNFKHITYTSIRDILKEMDISKYDKKIEFMIKDFIKTLEVNNMVEFDEFSKESKQYIEEIQEIEEKESKWKEESAQFFKEVKEELEDKLDDEWEFITRSTNIEINKKSWKNIYYKCALNDSHIKKGIMRIGIYTDSDMENREETWEDFKEEYDGDRDTFSDAAWIKEGKEKYFNQLMEGEKDLVDNVIDELYYLLKETEESIQYALKE